MHEKIEANPINITRIDHVVLRVRDLPRMIAFYQQVLGCRLERGPGEHGLAQMRAGDSLLDLIDIASPIGRVNGRAPDQEAPNVDHVCFLVAPWDPDAILERLAAFHVEFGDIASRYGATGPGPSVYLSDPEGNEIELKGGTG